MSFFSTLPEAAMFLITIAGTIAFFSIVRWVIHKLATIIGFIMVLSFIALIVLWGGAKIQKFFSSDANVTTNKVTAVHKEADHDFHLEDLDDLPDQIQNMLE